MSSLVFVDISHTYTLWCVFVHVLVNACSTKVLKPDKDLITCNTDLSSLGL